MGNINIKIDIDSELYAINLILFLKKLYFYQIYLLNTVIDVICKRKSLRQNDKVEKKMKKTT